jgi:tetratricopeptide (TPR) repeat protein
MGEVYWLEGESQQAIDQWDLALQIDPETADVLNNLAWALATTEPGNGGDPSRAVLLARHACDLTDNIDPTYLDTLAVAQAASGQFSDAVATAQKAIDLAQAAGQTQLAEGIKSRQNLYRNGQAFHPSKQAQ